MLMRRRLLGASICLAAAVAGALIDPHVPRIVTLVVVTALLYPGGVLLGLNEPSRGGWFLGFNEPSERRRRRRAAR